MASGYPSAPRPTYQPTNESYQQTEPYHYSDDLQKAVAFTEKSIRAGTLTIRNVVIRNQGRSEGNMIAMFMLYICTKLS